MRDDYQKNYVNTGDLIILQFRDYCYNKSWKYKPVTLWKVGKKNFATFEIYRVDCFSNNRLACGGTEKKKLHYPIGYEIPTGWRKIIEEEFNEVDAHNKLLLDEYKKTEDYLKWTKVKVYELSDKMEFHKVSL